MQLERVQVEGQEVGRLQAKDPDVQRARLVADAPRDLPRRLAS